ncbi:hypothetical protein PDO_1378 [Rhizobium sp. PDO1-076]|uniref:hypothetical protein n=1 Tax=Rhizobium sp. PDO1-076 TaxID=1125979 RepID=UPI00024E3AD0|nr:hypothetical protein [Rhizobium sp. PDO1-076]EHS52618.1 hypothetical protein PDO_1378 [Rhizobium sp. PDO1-076]
MAKWTLVKNEGSIEVCQWELPGELTEPQVEEIVRRMVCKVLSDDEIIISSLPLGDPKRYILLDRNEDPGLIRMGENPSIHMGENPFYVATYSD